MKGHQKQLQKKKTEIITARMTPADKREIQRLAKKAGMTVTDYLTACALQKPIVQIKGLDEMLSELKAQGRNLNQLTTLANMGRLEVVDGEQILQTYSGIFDSLLALTEEVE